MSLSLVKWALRDEPQQLIRNINHIISPTYHMIATKNKFIMSYEEDYLFTNTWDLPFLILPTGM